MPRPDPLANSPFGPGWSAADARRWILAFVAAGVVWRLVRYGLRFPLWGDEAALMLEVVERPGYADLLRPLGRQQVAPLGFLAAQLTAVRLAGTSEYALRLFPLLTGLAALVAFARLAWLALPPLGATVAVGVLASAHYVTRYSLDMKPYGIDLMVSAVLLLLALEWSREPGRRRWPVLLILAVPLGVACSYPSVFVAGAIALGLPGILRRRSADLDAWTLLALYAAVLALSFAGLLYLSANAQYVATRAAMVAYWDRGFPPAQPVRFLRWFLDVHTGEMLSYPLGGRRGGSTITFVLCLGGAAAFWRRGRGDLLRLLGWAFLLTLAAAALRRYPYGSSARVAQHLAPAIGLLVGAAVDAIVHALVPEAKRRVTSAVIAGALLALAAGGLGRDVLHPYHTKGHQTIYRMLSAVRQDAGAGVWLMDPFESWPWTVQWYLLRAVHGDRARLEGGQAPGFTLPRHSDWWVVNADPERAGDATQPPRAELAALGYALRHTSSMVLTSRPGVPRRVLETELWRRPP